jgi:serine protease
MDPKYKQQWNLGSSGIHVDSAWEHGRGSPRIVVAVIDSGVTAHPDLDSQFLRNIDGSVAGYDFVSKQVGSGDGSGWDSNPADPSARNDWHGTLVSGVIAAAANGSGVIGVAPETKLLPIRSMGETGGLISDTVAAIYWAIGEKIKDVPLNKNPAKVINLSIGNGLGLGCDASAKKALELAAKKGVIVVTAAGNESKPTYYSFPGNCGLSVNVAASTKSGDLATYSDFGPLIDVAAPGGEQSGGEPASDVQTLGILTTSNSGTNAPGAASYEVVEGTSFAAPQVTGVIALMLSLRSTLRPAEVEKILRNTATRYASGAFCQKQVADLPCGEGIVNASAAIDAVLSLP